MVEVKFKCVVVVFVSEFCLLEGEDVGVLCESFDKGMAVVHNRDAVDVAGL
jgi:hypothetical protein